MIYIFKSCDRLITYEFNHRIIKGILQTISNKQRCCFAEGRGEGKITPLKNPNRYRIRQREVGVLKITDPEMGSWLNCWSQ